MIGKSFQIWRTSRTSAPLSKTQAPLPRGARRRTSELAGRSSSQAKRSFIFFCAARLRRNPRRGTEKKKTLSAYWLLCGQIGFRSAIFSAAMLLQVFSSFPGGSMKRDRERRVGLKSAKVLWDPSVSPGSYTMLMKKASQKED